MSRGARLVDADVTGDRVCEQWIAGRLRCSGRGWRSPRQTADATVRSVANYPKDMIALEPATRGTMCIWSKREPRHFVDVVAALRQPQGRAHLIVCAHTAAEASSFASRRSGSRRSGRGATRSAAQIEEYAADAMTDFNAQGTFTTDDRD